MMQSGCLSLGRDADVGDAHREVRSSGLDVHTAVLYVSKARLRKCKKKQIEGGILRSLTQVKDAGVQDNPTLYSNTETRCI